MTLSPYIWVIIPAYNEANTLPGVIEKIRLVNDRFEIAVVDDGSADATCMSVEHLPVHLLRHPTNLGQGAALATGIRYALMNGADILVNFDADGQMTPDDIPLMTRQIVENGFDVVLGSRFLNKPPSCMPLSKKITLKLATLFTRLTTGLNITDTHNGFRVFSAQAARAIRITQNRMAHASEILSEIRRNKLKYTEEAVTIQYTDYSKAKGQSIFNSVNILFELLMGDKK
jgi:glycosyltransferase involved in cell wall biosynthesis